jgi:hypothetical protein
MKNEHEPAMLLRRTGGGRDRISPAFEETHNHAIPLCIINSMMVCFTYRSLVTAQPVAMTFNGRFTKEV